MDKRGDVLVRVKQLLNEAQHAEAATPNLGDSFMRGRRSALNDVMAILQASSNGDVLNSTALARKAGRLAEIVVNSRELTQAEMDDVVVTLRECEKELLKARAS
jgi:hypothetical protein